MNRTIEFEEEEYCDECREKGAYDFMGDLLCPKCLKKHRHEQRTKRHEQKQKKNEETERT